jgi:hypothetical protein
MYDANPLVFKHKEVLEKLGDRELATESFRPNWRRKQSLKASELQKAI